MIDIENPDDIYSWEMEKLWNAFNILLEKETDNGTELKTLYYNEHKKVRNGIKLKVLIHYFINENWHQLHPENQKARIIGIGKFDMEEFINEKEEREKLMRKILLENIEDHENTIPRGEIGQ